VNYNILSYLIGEGFKNVFKNKKSTFAALIIMLATMFTLGLCMAGIENISSIIKQAEKIVPIQIFLKDGLSASELNEVEDYIKSIETVESVSFTSKADALKEAKIQLADSADILESYKENQHPFPASYSITITDINKSDDIVNVLYASDSIKDKILKVNTPDIAITAINKADKYVKIFGFCIGGLLTVVSVIIIGNTIKLTVHARRREISIMKYVGATNNFIRAPFVVEGAVIGIIATAISILILGGVYQFIYGKIGGAVMIQGKACSLLQFGDIFPTIVGVYLAVGVGIGVLGSVLSMKKYLKV